MIVYNPTCHSFSNLMNELAKEEEKLSYRYNYSVPALNIQESEKTFEIELIVPGIKKEDLIIELEKNILTVSYSKKEQEEKKKYLKREFNYNDFKRSINLSKAVDSENIQAELANGILTLTISKKVEEVIPSRKIEVK